MNFIKNVFIKEGNFKRGQKVYLIDEDGKVYKGKVLNSGFVDETIDINDGEKVVVQKRRFSIDVEDDKKLSDDYNADYLFSEDDLWKYNNKKQAIKDELLNGLISVYDNEKWEYKFEKGKLYVYFKKPDFELVSELLNGLEVYLNLVYISNEKIYDKEADILIEDYKEVLYGEELCFKIYYKIDLLEIYMEVEI